MLSMIMISVLLMSFGIVAAVTCPTGTTSTFVETIEVLSDGSTVASINALENGVTYLLEASGTYRFANWGKYGIADAEWSYRSSAYTLDGIADWIMGEGYFQSECGLEI